jgi:hypothetical protein
MALVYIHHWRTSNIRLDIIENVNRAKSGERTTFSSWKFIERKIKLNRTQSIQRCRWFCVFGGGRNGKNRSRLDFLLTPTPYVFPFPLPPSFIRILASSFLPKQVNSIDSQSRNQKYGEVFCVFVR